MSNPFSKYNNQEGRCIWCGCFCPAGDKKAKNRPTGEHIIPRANIMQNGERRRGQIVVMACYDCNIKRGDDETMFEPHPDVLKVMTKRTRARVVSAIRQRLADR